MEKVFTEIESLFQDIKSPLSGCFQTGKSAAEIAEIFRHLKMPLREDVVNMYEWKNGVKDLYKKRTGEMELFPSRIMIPWELAVSLYVLEVTVNKSFGKYFFPLFASGGGDYILIYLDERKMNYGRLFLYSPAVLLDKKPMVIYDSLSALFTTILQLYRIGDIILT